MARIILLSQWFDPEPTFKGLEFAKKIQSLGYDVEVVTGFPNYPGGKLYDGYKIRLLHREVLDGVCVTRLPLFPSHDKSEFRRACNYLSFAISSLFYLLIVAKSSSIIYAYHPPIFVGFVASIIKNFRRTKVIIDVQDLWPDSLSATGMVKSKLVMAVINRICKYTYKKVDEIVVLSPGFKKSLMRRNIDENKITVIYNWALEKHIPRQQEALKNKIFSADHFNILFAGNMGPAQGLENILEAAVKIYLCDPRVKIILLGDGIYTKQLVHLAEEKKLKNVEFWPRVPMQDVNLYLAAADALLVHLTDAKLFEITIPSKTQAYMAIGRPMIMAVNGDAADLVREAQCGIVVKPNDSDDLCASIVKLARTSKDELKEFGQRGKEFYFENLSMSKGVSHFNVVFKRVLKSNGKNEL